MKLADPRTIQSNINAQRKTDIDQGIALARRVDSLREQIVNEENRVRLFKESTIKIVQSEIDAKIKERDTLLADIKSSQKIHDHLQKLLDKEWGKVEVEKSQLEFLQRRRDGLQMEAENSITEVAIQLKEIETEKQRQIETRKQLEMQAEESNNTLLEAQKRLSEAHEEERRVSAVIEHKKQQIAETEEVLRSTVNNITTRERELEVEWEDIHREKAKLADQRATLERAIARVNKL